MRRYSIASLMFSWRSISVLGVASPFCRPGVRLGLWRRLVHLGRPILKGFLGRRTIGFPSRVVIGLARWFSDGVRDGKRTAALENLKTPSSCPGSRAVESGMLLSNCTWRACVAKNLSFTAREPARAIEGRDRDDGADRRGEGRRHA
jgi:hypothetical protein